MLRIWICLLALVSQACLAMEVSPHFSRQLEPVMKLYQSGKWQQAQSKAAVLKAGSEAEHAWLAQLQASLAANLQQTAQASRYVEQALAYKEWPEQQRLPVVASARGYPGPAIQLVRRHRQLQGRIGHQG